MHTKSRVALLAGFLASSALGMAADVSLSVKNAGDFKKYFEVVSGDWNAEDGGVIGAGPRYDSLPGTALAGFVDDAHTYFVVHAVNLWRYALAGSAEWDNYTVAATMRILEPAPVKGVRPGQDRVFMNYQWGREAMGSDAAMVVRYAGPDRNYMVRLSSGYGHVELWKTKGGVVRVEPFAFEPNKDYRVTVNVFNRWIAVSVDGQELIRYYDPVEPIEKGRVGLAVRESKVRFSDIQVTPASALADAAPVHKPDFHVREWIGRKYIFDGDEPIGHLSSPTEPWIEEQKLVPGLMPFCAMAGTPSWGIAWKTNVQFNLLKEGAVMVWTWTLEEKNGESSCLSTWTLTYDQEIGGYLWDYRAKLTALLDGKPRWKGNLLDPFFYQSVAPATTKMPACRTFLNYALWLLNDGKFGCFPVTHQFNSPCSIPDQTTVKQGGFWATTVDDWAAVYELPPDNFFQYCVEYCAWGLDQHMTPSSAGNNGSEINKPARKGEVVEGHVRMYAFPPSKVKDLLAQSAPPSSAKTNDWVKPMLVHAEPVNRFDESVEAVGGDSKVRWLGAYAIDRSVGHGDRVCMRIDGANTGAKGENSPWLAIGSSVRTGPYVGLTYRIGMWVKAEAFKGKVAIKATKFNCPDPTRKVPDQKAALDINGKCDWTHVSFESDSPRLTHGWNMSIEVQGEGTVWVDDVEIVPIK